MANPTSTSGLRVKKSSGQATQTNMYYVPSTDGSAIFIGDAVKLAEGTSSDGFPVATVATSGDSVLLVGVCTGIVPTSYTNIYRLASVNQYILVDDNPLQVFEAVVNGSYTASSHNMANLDVGSGGNTTSGVSSHGISSSVSTSSAKQFRIVGVKVDADKSIGTDSIVDVMINQHQYGFVTTGV